MADVIGIRFKPGGKLYYFAPNEQNLLQGSMAIVETARGLECGEVVMERRSIPDEQLTHELKNVVRAATPEDLKRVEENRKKEAEAYDICLEKIAKHDLEMSLVGVEYAFDGSKILFCFTADGRVDFRELVKDLASVFKTRIELRQIGVRDEAKLLGGLGVCGRPFCCASFMGDFAPVSIKMAKEQGLSLNPVKISGTCGRLMCCLKYEEEAYHDLLKRTPRVGATVKTPEGIGTVVEVNLIAGNLKVRIGDDPEVAPKSFSRRQVQQLGKNGAPVPVEEDPYEDEEELELENEAEAAELAKLLDEPSPEHERSEKRRNNNHNRRGKGNHNNGDKPKNQEQKADQPQQSQPENGQKNQNGNQNGKNGGRKNNNRNNQNRNRDNQNKPAQKPAQDPEKAQKPQQQKNNPAPTGEQSGDQKKENSGNKNRRPYRGHRGGKNRGNGGNKPAQPKSE